MCRACDHDTAKVSKGTAAEMREVCRRVRSRTLQWWEKPVGSFELLEVPKIRRENAERRDPEPLPYYAAPIKPLPLWTERERLAELARQSRRLARQPAHPESEA